MDLRSGVRPRLEVVAALGYEPGTAFEIHESATLGRSPTADVRIDDPYASSAHARIFPRGQFMYIEDMGSTNGTYLNGRQLRKPEQLRVADTVRIGDTEYRYQE
jgi:pSer/pThr/pTyr-binding forkhead associated (FHA) protein